jgi:flagellar motor switch protein FliN/FliY
MADESQQPVQDEIAAPAADSDRGGIESLLEEAQSALASLDEPAGQLPPGVKPFELQDLFGAAPANEQASLDLLRDVQLDLKIELGRTQMHLGGCAADEAGSRSNAR